MIIDADGSPVQYAVSFVVPTFNVEKYLAACLDSLNDQIFRDFEIVLVDDASTDDTLKIAESYLEVFGNRLRIYVNERNLGASATRNKGLTLSRGDYVFFMDADDMLLPDGLWKIHRIAENFGVDVVNITKSYKVDESGGNPTLLNLKMSRISDEAVLENNLEWRTNGLINDRFAWAPWRKLSRREFLLKNRLFFPENIRRNVDEIWTFGVFLCAQKIIHVPLAIYLYRSSENSISRTPRTPAQKINSRVNNIIHNLKWINGVMTRLEFFESRPELRYAIFEHATQRLFKRLAKDTQKIPPSEIFLAIHKEFGNDFGQHDLVLPMLCTVILGYKKLVNKLQAVEK